MSASLSRPAVLVVEDEPLVRMYAVEILQDAGYDVIEAANAEQALAKLEARPDISVMFTDINMPGTMDGFALAREVHQRRPGIHLILTSGKMLADKNQVPGLCAFVSKPYTGEHLTGLMSTLLS
jgi:CheY-like chemotaxis protein